MGSVPPRAPPRRGPPSRGVEPRFPARFRERADPSGAHLPSHGPAAPFLPPEVTWAPVWGGAGRREWRRPPSDPHVDKERPPLVQEAG